MKIWDSIGRQELATLRGHTGDVWAVAFSDDGKLLAAADGDWIKPSHVRLYETETWKLRGSLQHTGEVLSIAFAAKAPILAAGSWDKTVKVFDLSKGINALPPPRPVK